MLRGFLQPLRARVALGRKLLPPITPAPPKQQQQQQTCPSSSSLPAVIQVQDPAPINRKNWIKLDLAYPLKPVIHRRAPSNKTPAPPAPPVATKVVSQNKVKKAKSQSPVDCRTPSKLQVLPPLKAPTPPSTPTIPLAPAPPHTDKPRAVKPRRPRLKKAAPLSVATAVEDTEVTEQKSGESVEAGEEEEVRECEEERKPVRVVKKTSKPQQTKVRPKLVKPPPVVCPEETILQAFRLLQQDDWEKKVEALTSVRFLCQNHTEVLLPRLHDVCLAVNKEVRNLRSVVSRAAMKTVAHMFSHLGRDMDAEAEGIVKAVLLKAGEASRFIREDVEMTLSHMVFSITPSRSMAALLNTGLSHRNATVRKATAQHLEELAEVMGESQVLSGKMDLTDRFVHAVSCLALDSAQEVRTHARNTLAFLASHPDLVKMVDKFAPRRDRDTVKDIISRC